MSESERGIDVRALSKDYRVHRRQAGLANALRSVFRRSYETVHAVKGLSFVIAPGERVGFLGPNGADNLSYLFNSLLDFGRWPVGIFRGFVRLFFTIVIPIALMTTYPAEALLGRLSSRTAALAVLGSAAFVFLGRKVWTRALRRYTSASS